LENINEDMIWQDLQPKYSNLHNEVHLITGKFYDAYLVPRWSWSPKWLAGETVWVIGITKQVPTGPSYQHGEIGKSIHILAETFASNQTMRFGLLNYHEEEELKDTLI
jgi:hypothetical protein